MTSPDIVLTILAVFTGIVALALLLQAFALMGLYRRVRDLSARLESVSTKVTKLIDSLSAQAGSFLAVATSTAEKVRAMQENVTAISEAVHNRVLEVDAFLKEATDSARLQLARFEDVIETTSHRIDETIDTLRDAVVVPITEAQAIVRGVRAGLGVLLGWRRLSVNRSHHDEEMFI
jgi:methyl-accepting chemotaxis protein